VLHVSGAEEAFHSGHLVAIRNPRGLP
jgi:hypothetical protein